MNSTESDLDQEDQEDQELASEAAAGGEDADVEKQPLKLEVKIDKPSACQRHVTLTVSPEDIERYLKTAFDKLVGDAAVPGFRSGRAPRKIVESRFKEQVRNQVKGELLMDSLAQLSAEHEFSAISEPNIDFEAIPFKEDGPLTFEFDIEVRPEFDLPNWKGLDLQRPAHELTDDEVEQQLVTLLHEYGKLVTHDGPAELGDYVRVDVQFFLQDGKLLSEIEGRPIRVRPKLSFTDAQLEGWDTLMVGAVAGDSRQATVKLGEVEDANLRGHEVRVEFDVLEVQRMKLPALTASFLEKLGDFKDEADFRMAIRAELERQLKYHQEQEVRRQITHKLTADADWDLPKELLRRQVSRELQRTILELRRNGFSNEVIQAHSNELQRNSFSGTARALKEHFILERISEEEKILDNPEDYDQEIALIAEQSDESPRRVRARLEKSGQMDTLRNQIVERKTIEMICSHAQFSDKPFKPQWNQVSAVEFSIAGQDVGQEIPEAKHGGEAEELRRPVERT